MAYTYGTVTNATVVGHGVRKEYEVRLGWQLNSQNIQKNTSNISLRLEVRSINSNYQTYGFNQTSTIGSQTFSAQKFDMRPSGEWKVFATRTYDVSHNADGSYSASKTGSFTTDANIEWTLKSGSASVSYTLPKIPRQANITSALDFNDEDNPTITYSNPAGDVVESLQACISLTGEKDDISYRDISKTDASYIFELTEEERIILRQATTDNPTRNIYFIVKTVIGGIEYISKSEAKTFTVINANPIFNNFEFEDINERTIALTGNNQSVILGYSNIKVTIPVANKAVAQKEATMSKYRFNNNEADYSDTEDVSIISNNVTSGEFIVYAIDSRKYAKPVLKTAVSVVDYKPLQKGNITTNRENGTSEDVILNIDGIINLINFGTKTNSILSAQYRYSIAGKNEWSELANLEIVVDENGNFSFDGKIKGDTDTLGFNVENAYNIEVYIKDELSEIKYTSNIGAGIPHIAYAKNGISIMGAYNESEGGLLQVGGKKINNPKVFNEYTNSQTDVYSCNYINNAFEETYSTDEIKTNKLWINGKPIYRKVIQTPVNGNSQTIDLGTTNVDLFVDGRVLLKGPNYTAIDYCYAESSGYNITKWVFSSSTNSILVSNMINATGTYYVVIEYTKTTD